MFSSIARRSAAASAMATLLATAAPLAVAAQTPSFPARPEPPRGAPNVLLIMTDDVGFGASSTFGGPIPTPTLEALAANGARYNAFHTTATCSPTRAALLTGRNQHSVGSGVVAEMATGYPGYNSVIPKSAAMIPRVLQQHGYSTAMFGKHHNTPQWEESPAAPSTHKPNAFGFDYFYGFFGGSTNQFAPALYENLNPVEPPADDPGYILDRDLADHAISWLRMQGTQAPGQPFFLYYAPGTLHAPVQAPEAWIQRFRGKFDGGWDELRQHTYQRQKQLGIIPRDAKLAASAPNARPWKDLSPDERRVAARFMEVYAAALAYSDHEIGRVIDELKQSGRLDNTLIIFIQGDNGADVQGGPNGAFSYLNRLNNVKETTAETLSRLDQLGGPTSYPIMPAEWARATNAPFPWNKTMASHRGGVSNGLVVSWPGRILQPRAVRGQFHHVVDMAPTIYEAVGIEPPAEVDGVAQQPLAGVSMVYSFGKPTAPSPHREQYFEMHGTLGLYRDGWMLSSRPTVSSQSLYEKGSNDLEWELYDLRKDYSQSTNVAAQYPDMVGSLETRFRALAAQYSLNPISTDRVNRIADGGRPGWADQPGRYRFYPSAMRYADGGFPEVKNRSWSLEAAITVPPGGADGVIVTQGGALAGWGLLIEGGKPQFIYRLGDRDESVLRLSGATALAPGPHRLSMAFHYDGGGIGKGGRFTLSADGQPVAEGRLEQTVGLIWGDDAAVGRDTGTPLTSGYRVPFAYGGTIHQVDIDTREAAARP